MKVSAIYYPIDYNAFAEQHSKIPYEINVEAPDDADMEWVAILVQSQHAIKSGYRFVRVEKTEPFSTQIIKNNE